MQHENAPVDQTIGIDLSWDPCDHPLMREVGDGIWLRKNLAKFTYSYLLQLCS